MKIMGFLISIGRPAREKVAWLSKVVVNAVVGKPSISKEQIEIYGDRVRQYQIKRIRVLNKSGVRQEFSVIQNIPDGNCLFRAISQAIFRNEQNHATIRLDVVNYITQSDRWKDYFPFIRGQHEHLTPQKITSSSKTLPPSFPNKNVASTAEGIYSKSETSFNKLVQGTTKLKYSRQELMERKKSEKNVRPFHTSNENLMENTNSRKDFRPLSRFKSLTSFQILSTTKNNIRITKFKNKILQSRERLPLVHSPSTSGTTIKMENEKKGTSDQQNTVENEDESEELREMLRQEYKNYMSTEKSYGTLQELVAAAEYFKFNLVVFREIPSGGFNVQSFCERKFDTTHFFLFTGHQEDGHFELMDRTQSSKVPFLVLNGSYVEVDHSPKDQLITIQEESSCIEKKVVGHGKGKSKRNRFETSKILPGTHYNSNNNN